MAGSCKLKQDSNFVSINNAFIYLSALEILFSFKACFLYLFNIRHIKQLPEDINSRCIQGLFNQLGRRSSLCRFCKQHKLLYWVGVLMLLSCHFSSPNQKESWLPSTVNKHQHSSVNTHADCRGGMWNEWTNIFDTCKCQSTFPWRFMFKSATSSTEYTNYFLKIQTDTSRMSTTQIMCDTQWKTAIKPQQFMLFTQFKKQSFHDSVPAVIQTSSKLLSNDPVSKIWRSNLLPNWIFCLK